MPASDLIPSILLLLAVLARGVLHEWVCLVAVAALSAQHCQSHAAGRHNAACTGAHCLAIAQAVLQFTRWE